MYLDETFPIFVGSILYVGFLVRNIRRHKSLIEHVIFTCFYAYTVGVLTVTFFPIPITPSEIAHLKATGPHWSPNLLPFRDVSKLFTDQDPWYTMGRQLVGNTLLLLPLGFYLPLRNPALKFRQAVLAGFFVSLGIELTQLLLCIIFGYTYRLFDVNDLICNTLGCAIGYGCFKWIYPHLPESIKDELSSHDRSTKQTDRLQTGR